MARWSRWYEVRRRAFWGLVAKVLGLTTVAALLGASKLQSNTGGSWQSAFLGALLVCTCMGLATIVAVTAWAVAEDRGPFDRPGSPRP